MTHQTATESSERGSDTTRQTFAAVGSIAGGVVLLTVGILQFLEGISAVAKDKILVVGPQYTYQFDVTAWGGIHIVLGVLIAVTGISLMAGLAWARITALILVALSIIANFLWLPYNPWWAVLVIALDVFVIWAISTWDPDRF
ncbi:hypothetical protein G4X40_01535 [Rhodococcus sp. D2-41]|uniref:DUF7144 family membrane protein n=1 Tax=Speluncibacter jeojiensis TaxID=2710754 RepID=UPI00240FADD1|nr:hypothetical protein [Rhodococcus sp. D2-41]MDG3008826.1 hypothetical protein [Rhodococcus sp. D2-41]